MMQAFLLDGEEAEIVAYALQVYEEYLGKLPNALPVFKKKVGAFKKRIENLRHTGDWRHS